jgi:hypothetical protein
MPETINKNSLEFFAGGSNTVLHKLLNILNPDNEAWVVDINAEKSAYYSKTDFFRRLNLNKKTENSQQLENEIENLIGLGIIETIEIKRNFGKSSKFRPDKQFAVNISKLKAYAELARKPK